MTAFDYHEYDDWLRHERARLLEFHGFERLLIRKPPYQPPTGPVTPTWELLGRPHLEVTEHTRCDCQPPDDQAMQQVAWRVDMGLRGIQPEAVNKRFKALFFGAAGSGKTTAAIQFPRPYLIDTEQGAENDQYVRRLKQSGGLYYHTTDFDEMVSEITSLLTTQHDMRTVIIDPLTVPYALVCDKEAQRLSSAKDPSGAEFGRNKQIPDRKVRHLLNLLLRLDMNVIITSHSKAEWKDSKPTGSDTYDCYNKLDYLFDLAIQIQVRGKERVGIVKKTRVEAFELGEVFPFTYDEIANRYGREVLERGANPQTLATPEQVVELNRLIGLLNIPAETTDKWLEKAKAETLSEMPADTIQTCIEHLKKKVAA